MRVDGLDSAGAEGQLTSPPAFHVIVLVSGSDGREEYKHVKRWSDCEIAYGYESLRFISITPIA